MKIFSVDRFEGELAVVLCDDGEVLEIEKSVIAGLSERDVFSAEVCNGKLLSVTPMPEERDRRLAAARRRLDRFKSRSNS